jgi:hypothetical protein
LCYEGKTVSSKKKKKVKGNSGSKVLCGSCSLLVRRDEIEEHFRVRHPNADLGVRSQKAKSKSTTPEKYPFHVSDEQPRFEAGFQYLQGGSPGLNKKKR